MFFDNAIKLLPVGFDGTIKSNLSVRPPPDCVTCAGVSLIRPMRSDNGYRLFRDSDCHKPAFLGRARALGFTIEDCRTLLALYEDQSRASADVKKVAEDHLAQIDDRIAQLKEMRATLAGLVSACAGDDRPDCPILNDFAAKP